jgi:hypothetical protein
MRFSTNSMGLSACGATRLAGGMCYFSVSGDVDGAAAIVRAGARFVAACATDVSSKQAAAERRTGPSGAQAHVEAHVTSCGAGC